MHALILALTTLSADAPPVVVAPPVTVEVAVRPRLQRVIVGYRKQCGPNGCTMIPIYRTRIVAPSAEVKVEANSRAPALPPQQSAGCANGACSTNRFGWRPLFRWRWR